MSQQQLVPLKTVTKALALVGRTAQSSKKASSKKSKSQKNSKKSSNSGVSRALLSVSATRSSMSFRSRSKDGQPVLCVTGTEVVAELSTPIKPADDIHAGTQYQLVGNVVINPLNPILFPRLSGLASVFDRFRVKSLRATYNCGCPATMPGSIGIAFLTDPNDPTPTSFVTMGEYQNSALSTVSANLSVDYKPREEVWQFTSSSSFPLSGASASGNQVSPFYGETRLLLAMGHFGMDVPSGTFLGYCSLGYEIELMRSKPLAPSQLVNGYGPADTSYNAVTPPNNLSLPMSSSIRQVRGWFDCINEGLQLVSEAKAAWANYFGDSNMPTRNNHALVPSGDWVFRSRNAITGASVEDRKELPRGWTDVKQHDVGSLNGSQIVVKTICKKFMSKARESYQGYLIFDDPMDPDDHERFLISKGVGRPATAGTVTCYLYALPLDPRVPNALPTLAGSQVYSVSGATTLDCVIPFGLATPTEIVPTWKYEGMTFTRDTNAGGWSLEKNDADNSSAQINSF